jgi:hypothetical protein
MSVVANMSENANMNRASAQVQSAGNRILQVTIAHLHFRSACIRISTITNQMATNTQAKTIVPELPAIDVANVNRLRGGFVFLGSTLTEVMRRKKITQSQQDVRAMIGQVQTAMHWLSTR